MYNKPPAWLTGAAGGCRGFSLSRDVAGVFLPAGGKYCENCHVSTSLAGGEISLMRESVCAYALDPEPAKALWVKGEEMSASGLKSSLLR